MVPVGDRETDVSGRRIADAGTPEAAWRQWEGLDRIPRVDAATLVPVGKRAVILAPHPDDEVLGAGGLLCELRAMSREIEIIGVTDGGASHPGSTFWPEKTLVVARRAERKAGLCQLGVRSATTHLNYQDGHVAQRCLELGDELQATLRPDDVVFAPWRLDGHPDHEATGQAAALACRAVGASLFEMPIWMWHWAHPHDVRVPWSSALRLDMGEHLMSKRRAIQCHRSQTQRDPSTGAAPIVPDWALARWLRPFEVFFVSEGRP